MANVFETVILKMRDMGMFQFMLPFMLTSAIFYGLLRKSRIFGDEFRSITVNAVVSLVAAFMVWSAPIILGVDIETGLASFFLQGTTATLVVLVGMLITSMFFPPDLAAELKSLNILGRHGGKFLLLSFVVVAAVLVSSGLIDVFMPAGFGEGAWSDDNVSSVLMLVLLLGTVYVLLWGGGNGGEGKK